MACYLVPFRSHRSLLFKFWTLCVFEPPFGGGRDNVRCLSWALPGGLGATYDDHLRLVGKRVGNFLLVVIELFSLGITDEALRSIIGSKSAILLQRGPADHKFQAEGVAPTNHSFSQKTGLKVLSYGIKYGLIFHPFCHN